MRVRTESKREAILDAASQVFLESGFEGASMAEIATRVGGSKATLYGYFGSKEELFMEVTHEAARRQIAPVFDALGQDTDDLPTALQRFGERTTAFFVSDPSIQARRAVIAESGRSDIGLRFYESGPKKGIAELAAFLDKQTARGTLRPCDTALAARQLLALLETETVIPMLFGIQKKMSQAALRKAVGNAVDTFLRAYGTAAVGERPPA